MLHEQSLPMVIMQSLGLTPPIAIDTSPMLAKWNNMALAVDTFTETVDIAVVGKYTGLSDAYLSIIKALKHSAIAASRKLNILWVEAQHLEPGHESKDVEGYTKAWQTVRSADGVLVPGGFGNRGVEGKILAANFARTSKTPYLGVCLGMQCAVIEFARNMCGLTDANSTEFDDKAEHQVSLSFFLFVLFLLFVGICTFVWCFWVVHVFCLFACACNFLRPHTRTLSLFTHSLTPSAPTSAGHHFYARDQSGSDGRHHAPGRARDAAEGV